MLITKPCCLNEFQKKLKVNLLHNLHFENVKIHNKI